MPMHLLGPAYTTTNHSKRKSKLSDSKFTKWALDWRDDCKRCKKHGIKPKTLNEYISYRQGNYKPKLRGTPMPEYNVDRSHREKYPSQAEVGVSFKKEPNTYTGTLIKGIATMHKSNAVPIINQEQAIEVATMRRG
jgi:hypothetical protein